MDLAETLFVKKLHDGGVPLANADLVAFEQELGAALPADYRQFLLLKNGGHFYEPVVCPLPTREYSDALGLSIVFRLLEPTDENTNDLRNVRDIHRGRLPRNTLAIADDGDNLLLIELDPEKGGALSLWVRDDEMIRAVEDNRIAVAPSFTDLALRCQVSAEYFSNLEQAEPFRAIEHFDLARLRRLLDAGLDPDATNERGTPLLVAAARELNFDAAALLLERGATPNTPDRDGHTALRHVAGSGAIDFIKLLLRHGAHRHLPGDAATNIADSLYPPPRGSVIKLLRGTT
jgi:hypothetical protein